jgi:hypothetical protein
MAGDRRRRAIAALLREWIARAAGGVVTWAANRPDHARVGCGWYRGQDTPGGVREPVIGCGDDALTGPEPSRVSGGCGDSTLGVSG